MVSEQTRRIPISWGENYRFKTHDLSADKDLRHVGYKLNERRDSNGYRSIDLVSTQLIPILLCGFEHRRCLNSPIGCFA